MRTQNITRLVRMDSGADRRSASHTRSVVWLYNEVRSCRVLVALGAAHAWQEYLGNAGIRTGTDVPQWERAHSADPAAPNPLEPSDALDGLGEASRDGAQRDGDELDRHGVGFRGHQADTELERRRPPPPAPVRWSRGGEMIEVGAVVHALLYPLAHGRLAAFRRPQQHVVRAVRRGQPHPATTHDGGREVDVDDAVGADCRHVR